MDNETFIKMAKQRLFAELHPNRQMSRPNEAGMYVSWLCKIGKNNKCLIGIIGSDDYYEISYFGNEGVFVMDHYSLKKHKYIQRLFKRIAAFIMPSNVLTGVKERTGSLDGG